MSRNLNLPQLLLFLLLLLPFFVPLLQLVGLGLQLSPASWPRLMQNYLLTYISNTLILVLLSGMGCIIWGVSCAWLITHFNFPWRRQLTFMLIMPLACPVYIAGFSYSELLANIIPNFHNLGFAALIFAATLYPYVYIFTRLALRDQSMDYIYAAQTLGLKYWGILRRISLPLALPFISFGLLLAIIEVINDYGLVNHYAINTVSLGIYNVWLGLGDFNAAVALALITAAVIMAIMLAEAYLLQQRRRYENQSRKSPIKVKQLRGAAAYLACGWCLLPVILGFWLPVLLLSLEVWDSAGLEILPKLLDSLANTLVLIIATIIAAALFATSINYLGRNLAPAWQSLSQTINICYALPGTLLGFTCIIIFTSLNQLLPNYLHLGGLLLLLVAYSLRFTPPANRGIYHTLSKITPAMEMSTQLLASSRWQGFRRIHIPLLSNTLLSSSLIVAIEVLKELPLLLILRPFNFETLASFAYQYASDERLGEAALPALVMIAAALPLVYLINHLADSLRQEYLS